MWRVGPTIAPSINKYACLLSNEKAGLSVIVQSANSVILDGAIVFSFFSVIFLVSSVCPSIDPRDSGLGERERERFPEEEVEGDGAGEGTESERGPDEEE